MLEYLQQLNIFLFDLCQFIYHISWTYLICCTILIINLYMFFNAYNILNKLTWFFFTLIACSSLIWLCSLEIIGFILILTELTLIFLFFIVMTQITNKISTQFNIKHISFIILFLLMCCLNVDSTLTLQAISYYNALFLVITADYFFLYYFLIIYLDIVIYIGLILGLFSIFFIFLYYHLKKIHNTAYTKHKTIYFIKKQNFLHQAIYSNYLRWFQ